MLEFVDKHFITDHGEKDGTLVVSVDTQGLWEYGDMDVMRWIFPRAYKIYKQMCIQRALTPGTAILLQEQGFKIVLLVTKRHRNDKQESILVNFKSCLERLANLLPSDEFIYSNILNRKDKCFQEMLKILEPMCKGSNCFNWFIYKQENVSAQNS